MISISITINCKVMVNSDIIYDAPECKNCEIIGEFGFPKPPTCKVNQWEGFHKVVIMSSRTVQECKVNALAIGSNQPIINGDRQYRRTHAINLAVALSRLDVIRPLLKLLSSLVCPLF